MQAVAHRGCLSCILFQPLFCSGHDGTSVSDPTPHGMLPAACSVASCAPCPAHTALLCIAIVLLRIGDALNALPHAIPTRVSQTGKPAYKMRRLVCETSPVLNTPRPLLWCAVFLLRVAVAMADTESRTMRRTLATGRLIPCWHLQITWPSRQGSRTTTCGELFWPCLIPRLRVHPSVAPLTKFLHLSASFSCASAAFSQQHKFVVVSSWVAPTGHALSS